MISTGNRNVLPRYAVADIIFKINGPTEQLNLNCSYKSQKYKNLATSNVNLFSDPL